MKTLVDVMPSRPQQKSAFWKSETLFAFRSPTPAPLVSVIIPTLNEAENLPYVLPRIPEWVHEVIVVDGRSTDNTVEVAQALRPDVRIVNQRKRGKGEALRCGLEAATGDIVVLIDADGSNDPTEINAFVGTLMAGADFAKGTRFMQGAGTSDMSLLRKLGNMGFVALVRVLFGTGYTDLCYGYNAFWRDILPALHLDGDGFEIETIMNIRAIRARLKIAEVPSFEYDRVHGVSRLRTFPDGWRVLKSIIREFAAEVSARLPRQLPLPAAQPEPLIIPNTSGPRVNEGQGD